MQTTTELRNLAERQHGVVARWQCRSAGAHHDVVRRFFERGEWEARSPRVLRLRGAPMTERAQLMAAVLDAGPGAAASHRSAAALWQLPSFRIESLDVTRPYGAARHRPALGRLHRTRSLPAHHVTSVDGIPVTTPARTMFDLAGLLHPGRAERALDHAVAMSPGLLRALHRMLPELAERGRTGIALMRELLGARPMGFIAPASGLEARVVRLLAEAGIAARRQADLGGDDWIGRVDLLVEGTNVVVEVDSGRFHTSRLDRERDTGRDLALRDAGFEPVRVTEEDAWHAPDRVIGSVRAALAASVRRNASSRTHSASQNDSEGRGADGGGGSRGYRPMPLAM